MNWIVWTNQGSGNRSTRAHIASTITGRTLCGANTGDLWTKAPRTVTHCGKCEIALKEKRAELARLVAAVSPPKTDEQIDMERGEAEIYRMEDYREQHG